MLQGGTYFIALLMSLSTELIWEKLDRLLSKIPIWFNMYFEQYTTGRGFDRHPSVDCILGAANCYPRVDGPLGEVTTVTPARTEVKQKSWASSWSASWTSLISMRGGARFPRCVTELSPVDKVRPGF